MKRYLLVLSGLLCLAGPLAAQTTTPPTSAAPGTTGLQVPLGRHRGSIYFSWGYNRDWYTRSTIRFHNNTTDNYDFTKPILPQLDAWAGTVRRFA